MPSRLAIYLFKHMLSRMLACWVILTAIVFIIGVVEILMASNAGSGISAIADAFIRRTEDLNEYIAETMPFAGYVGLLISFWKLAQSRELEQLRLMGARHKLIHAIISVGLIFGLLEVMLVNPLASETSIISEDIRLVRKQDNGKQIILYAKKYNTENGNITKGVRVLHTDSSFQVLAVYHAEKGTISEKAWTIRNGYVQTIHGNTKAFTEKSFPIKTDVVALTYALQTRTRDLSVYELPAAYFAARDNARSVRPFSNLALFFIHLPLVYIAFGGVAFAIAIYLPPRGTNAQLIALVIFLPCSIKLAQYILWIQVEAQTMPAILPALAIPTTLGCAAAFFVRTQRLFT